MNYVYPIDDKADGHFDIYKHDFWDYPWPQALGWFQFRDSGILKCGVSSRWLLSLYYLMRNSDEMTIEKTHPIYLAQNPNSKPLKVNKLLPFKRTLVLTQNSDMITNLDGLEELNNPDNDADIKG